MTASTLHGQQNVSCADQHMKKKGRLHDAGEQGAPAAGATSDEGCCSARKRRRGWGVRDVKHAKVSGPSRQRRNQKTSSPGGEKADVKDDNKLMHYAWALPHMNVGTATRERAERREMPQMPWPLHQHGRMQK